MKTISFFGKSTVDENTIEYITTKQLAKEVVRVGFGVIHGGYAGGIMQAVSEGAQEAIEEENLSPKFNLGIPEERFDKDWSRVSKAVFSKPAADIFDRLRLVTSGDIVIVAPIGGDGTALELDIAIHENLLTEYTGAPIKPIIFLLTETGTDWKKFLESRSLLATNANIFEKGWLYFADSSEQVMSILSKLIK